MKDCLSVYKHLILKVLCTFLLFFFSLPLYSYHICQQIKIPAYKTKSRSVNAGSYQSSQAVDFQMYNKAEQNPDNNTSNLNADNSTTSFKSNSPSQASKIDFKKEYEKDVREVVKANFYYDIATKSTSTTSSNAKNLEAVQNATNFAFGQVAIEKISNSNTASSNRKPFEELSPQANQQSLERAPGLPPDPGDIPVGDGTYVFVLSAAIYALLKFRLIQKTTA